MTVWLWVITFERESIKNRFSGIQHRFMSDMTHSLEVSSFLPTDKELGIRNIFVIIIGADLWVVS